MVELCLASFATCLDLMKCDITKALKTFYKKKFVFQRCFMPVITHHPLLPSTDTSPPTPLRRAGDGCFLLSLPVPSSDWLRQELPVTPGE